MAKQPSKRKRETGLGLSDKEIDAALLLTELWRGVHHNGSTSGSGMKLKEVRVDNQSSNAAGTEGSCSETPTTTLAKGIFDLDDDDEDENDVHLRRRRKLFRSVVDIYRSTEPLDNYNLEKKQKVVGSRKCSVQLI